MRRFVVSRRNLREARWETVPDPQLAEGAVRLAVESFALTANNITYAAFGDAMRYWEFFPTGDAATGCVPVWGFATVTHSRCEGVAVGDRLYGFWPMADAATLVPGLVDAGGFSDEAAHRRGLHAVYNRYRFCRSDPGYDAAREAEQALLQPLFTTAFLIDDHLADNALFGASQVLLGSASSKTAYATAFCLARRGGAGLIGLTSPSHLAFARALGCYDQVVPYEEVAALDPARPTAYVDMSGSAPVRAAVHRHFGDRLRASCAVGGTRWEELGPKGEVQPLPGARPTLFFAPAQFKKRQADWGTAGLQRRIAEAWLAFLRTVRDPARPWLEPVWARGPQAVAATYAALVDGRADPQHGHMLSP